MTRLANDLLRSDAVSGYNLLSGIAALTGNVDATREYANRAIRLSSDPSVIGSLASMLGNLGFFAEAGRLFRQSITVERLPQRDVGMPGISNGSFLALDEALTKAGNMPTAIPDSVRKAIAVAASIL
jgi:hypothetical protein